MCEHVYTLIFIVLALLHRCSELHLSCVYVFLSTFSSAPAHTAASHEIAMCSAPRCLENIILLTSDEYEAHCGRHFHVCCGEDGNI